MRVYSRFRCISGLSPKQVASVIFRQFLIIEYLIPGLGFVQQAVLDEFDILVQHSQTDVRQVPAIIGLSLQQLIRPTRELLLVGLGAQPNCPMRKW